MIERIEIDYKCFNNIITKSFGYIFQLVFTIYFKLNINTMHLNILYQMDNGL